MSDRDRSRKRVRRVVAGLVAVGLLQGAAPAPVAAQEGAQGAPARQHTVRRGDTLWDLARAYLSNPFLWPAIYEANRQTVRNPHWIYPSERLLIPGVWGSAGASSGDAAGARNVARRGWEQPQPSRFLRGPGGAPATVLETAPEVVRPLVRAAEYRSTPWLADLASVGVRARVAALVDPADVSERMPTTLRPRDQVYLTPLDGVTPEAGDSLLIVRPGGTIDGHGQVIQPLGVLYVDSVPGGIASATVVRQFGDARIGDVVLAVPAVPGLPTEHGDAEAAAPTGQLLAFLDTHPLYGSADYGFVDLGRAAGVAIGDELSVYVAARAGDTPRPATAVATVRVIRVEGATATVRVIGVRSTALAPGLPVRLVRRAS